MSGLLWRTGLAWMLHALSGGPLWAESVQDANVHAWFMYFGDHPAGAGKWGVHTEAQFRRARAGLAWQQLLLRPGLNYQLSPNAMLTFGYAFVRSSPYGGYPARSAFPEHRVYEQFLLRQRVGKLPLQHRLRLEQRLVGIVPRSGSGVDWWEPRNRFRYMLRGDIPLRLKTAGKKRFGLALYNEFFVHAGANRGIRYLDQNRAYGALTYRLNKWNRLEFGYLHQYVPQRNGLVSEHNHTLQFALFSVAPFGKKE
jgi:Protein of unknown function (DUF2490)